MTDIINSKIDNDQYTESMKDILRNIKDVFDITVEHAPFEIDKITFEVLQSMIKIASASDKALKTFDNQEEFKNTLGKKIEEQINKLSDVKKILSQYNNDFKDYSEEDSKYSEISSAIDLNNKNIEDIKTNQIPDIEKQIDKKDKTIGAYITVTADRAIESAKAFDEGRCSDSEISPLAGIPCGIKDNMCTKGIKTTCSSKMLENFVSPYDGTVVKKVEDEGMISLGNLNMDEFAMGGSCLLYTSRCRRIRRCRSRWWRCA